jgi:hypothetical protein
MYAAQTIPQIDAEIAEKGHFWMETKYFSLSGYKSTKSGTGRKKQRQKTRH